MALKAMQKRGIRGFFLGFGQKRVSRLGLEREKKRERGRGCFCFSQCEEVSFWCLKREKGAGPRRREGHLVCLLS